jgi:hypothetical protein
LLKDDLSVYGKADIVSLVQCYENILSEEDEANIPSEWQQLKVRLSMQKSGHP